MIVTSHAIKRYIERVDPTAKWDAARDALQAHARAVGIAAAFGCRTVRTATCKLVLDGETVVTVLPRHASGAWSAPLAERVA